MHLISRVSGFGFRDPGSGFRVQGSGFRVYGSEDQGGVTHALASVNFAWSSCILVAALQPVLVRQRFVKVYASGFTVQLTLEVQ